MRIPPGARDLEPASAAVQKGRARRKWLLRLGLGVAVLAVLLWRGGPSGGATAADVGRVLRGTPAFVLPLSVAFYLAGQALSAFKWQLLLRAQGAPVPLAECCRLYLVGMFCNLWLPTSIGGDAARALLATRYLQTTAAHSQTVNAQATSVGATDVEAMSAATTDVTDGAAAPRRDATMHSMAHPAAHPAAVATASIFVERLTGLLALLLIGACALIVETLAGRTSNATQSGAQGATQQTMRLLVAALALAFLLLAACGVSLLAVRRLSHGRTRLFGFDGGRAASDLARVWNPKRREMRTALGAAMLLSLLFQSSQVVLNIGLARAVGLELPAGVFWWLAPALALASLLPVGIGGLGVREAAALTLLSATQSATHSASYSAVAPPLIVAWSLLWQATVWLAGLPGALWWSAGQPAAAAPESGS